MYTTFRLKLWQGWQSFALRRIRITGDINILCVCFCEIRKLIAMIASYMNVQLSKDIISNGYSNKNIVSISNSSILHFTCVYQDYNYDYKRTGSV